MVDTNKENDFILHTFSDSTLDFECVELTVPECLFKPFIDCSPAPLTTSAYERWVNILSLFTTEKNEMVCFSTHMSNIVRIGGLLSIRSHF